MASIASKSGAASGLMNLSLGRFQLDKSVYLASISAFRAVLFNSHSNLSESLSSDRLNSLLCATRRMNGRIFKYSSRVPIDLITEAITLFCDTSSFTLGFLRYSWMSSSLQSSSLVPS